MHSCFACFQNIETGILKRMKVVTKLINNQFNSRQAEVPFPHSGMAILKKDNHCRVIFDLC